MSVKVLCVEDEPDIQTLAQLALESVGGFTVKMCGSGEEALREIPLFKPDLVLLDVMMPGMDGLETLKALIRQPGGAGIPVVFMTAMVQPDDVRRYRNLGAVDVIAKPFDAMALSDKVNSILGGLRKSSALKQNEFNQRLESLRNHYSHELPAKLHTLKSKWESIKLQPTAAALDDLLRYVHNLSGSGATFNFPDISLRASILETKIRALDSLSVQLSSQEIQFMDEQVTVLENAVINSLQASAQAAINAIKHHKIDAKMLLVCDESVNIPFLREQLDHFSIANKSVAIAPDLKSTIEAGDPAEILLLSSSTADKDAFSATLMALKHDLGSSLNIIAIVAEGDFYSRLDAVRLGASAYYVSPVKVTELVNYIRSQLFDQEDHAYRILIVDDDSEQAHFLALLLEKAGMITRVATHPTEVIETLAQFQPELILMDLYMPECSGMELASVIRQHSQYNGINIAFLSTEDNVDKHIQALQAGGDDFIVKSISPERLFAKIETKLKRSRIIQDMMVRDHLTGLYNRATMEEYLRREMSKIRRQPGIFSFVMLDLDHFKFINDRFGHPAGDEVLKALGLLLRQRLRGIDIPSRYGGEEFSVILPNTDATQAKQLFELLTQKFSALKFKAENEEFSVTFSAGIAEYPQFDQINILVEAADQALYQAKKAGRNRVVIFAPSAVPVN